MRTILREAHACAVNWIGAAILHFPYIRSLAQHKALKRGNMVISKDNVNLYLVLSTKCIFLAGKPITPSFWIFLDRSKISPRLRDSPRCTCTTNLTLRHLLFAFQAEDRFLSIGHQRYHQQDAWRDPTERERRDLGYHGNCRISFVVHIFVCSAKHYFIGGELYKLRGAQVNQESVVY